MIGHEHVVTLFKAVASTLISAVVGAAIAWGAMRTEVTDHARRIEAQEVRVSLLEKDIRAILDEARLNIARICVKVDAGCRETR